LTRELFELCEEHNITMSAEWVPREENSLADELTKLIIPDDSMLRRSFFRQPEKQQGIHMVDLFASDANNKCGRFYSLHWCRGTAGVNVFAHFWGGEPVWANCPYKLLGRVWRKLRHTGAIAIVLVPM